MHRRVQGSLTVSLLEARELAPKDKRGTSDPYVILTLGGERRKSKTIPRNLNPKWNESFALAVYDLQEMLQVEVFDKDLLSKDDFLGCVSLPVEQIVDSFNGQPIFFELSSGTAGHGKYVSGWWSARC